MLEYSTAEYFKKRMQCRIVKTLPDYFLPHNYEYVIWVDANFDFFGDPKKAIKQLLKNHDFAGFTHPLRSCVYQEMDAVVKCKREFQDVVDRQKKYYLEKGY